MYLNYDQTTSAPNRRMTSHCSHARTGNIASILMSWKHYAFIVDCETETHFISIMFATFTSSFKYCGLPLSNFSPIFQDIFLISQRNQWKMQKARDNCRFFVPPRTSWDDEQCGRLVDGDRIESWQTAPRVPASQPASCSGLAQQIYPGHEHNIFVKKST